MTEHSDNKEKISSAAEQALILSNGRAAPLEALPLLEWDLFARCLCDLAAQGGRLASLFAMPRGRGGDDAVFQVVAVMADDAAQRLLLFSAEAENSYASLTPDLPQAHLFEREIYEKHGLLPEGHPWLKPVRFPHPSGPKAGLADFYRVEGDEVHEVAVGPIHAGIIECGHFRFQCLGELVMHLEISLGYHHRGAEALLLGGPDSRSLPLLETLSGDASIAYAWAWCTLLEALSGQRPSPRGQVLRALALELERLANHSGDMGALAGDVGFLPTQAWCGRLRGDWLNMSALLCGNRFGRGFVCPGGTAFDVDAPLLAQLKERLEATTRDLLGALEVLWDSTSVMARFSGIGALSAKEASELGLVGVAARACGLERDVRRTQHLDGVPASPEPALAPWGDVHARARVRHDEIVASSAFCRRLLDEFLSVPEALETADEPGRELHNGAFADPSLAPEHIAVSLVEAWRGEVCQTAVTGKDGKLRAIHLVDPSFHNWNGLALALRGQQISDFPLCNKSFNLSYCGHDL